MKMNGNWSFYCYIWSKSGFCKGVKTLHNLASTFRGILHILRNTNQPIEANSRVYVWHRKCNANSMNDAIDTTERKQLTRQLLHVADRHTSAYDVVRSIESAIADLNSIPTVGFWDTFQPTGSATVANRRKLNG